MAGIIHRRHVSDRFLAAAQNASVGSRLSQCYMGYRGYTRELLEAWPLEVNSDGFVFDNQALSHHLRRL
jgi:hypothetical protein